MPKISQLDPASAPDGTELFPVVQNSVTKKMNLDQVKSWLRTAPYDILLSGTEVYENSPVGTLVGTLTAESNIAGAVYTFSIVGGDTTLFQIDGQDLEIAESFTFTDKPTTTVTIRVTENTTGNFYDEVFTFDTLQNLGTLPVNTVAPSFTGVPEENVPFTFNPGTWTVDDNTVFEYQILQNATNEILGARQTTYTPAADDVGTTLRLRVRATAVGRPTVEVLSAETPAVIAESTGPITALTTVSETASSITVAFPRQDPALRWQYRYKIGSDGTLTSGVFFTPTNHIPDGSVLKTTISGLSPETQYYIQHRWETATGVFSAWAPVGFLIETTPAETVGVGAPTNTGVPTLSFAPNSLIPGSVVSVTTGTWDANPTITGFTYAFYRRSGSTDTLVQAFSTTSSYTLVTADVGFNIVAVVKATNASGATNQATAASSLVQAAPAEPGNPSGNSEVEMFPPNLINPVTVTVSTNADFWTTVSVTGDTIQDAILVSQNGIAERNNTTTVTGFANAWLEDFNFGPGGFLRYYHGRGEKWNHRVQFAAKAGPQRDPFWIQTNVPENGLTHRLTRAGFYAQTAAGTWYANNSFCIITGNCNSAGTWTIDAYGDQNSNYAVLPAVNDVFEIYHPTTANKRWFRITALTIGSGLGERRYTITGMDVTEPAPGNKVVSNLKFATCGYAIRSFSRTSGVNSMRFVDAFNGGTPQGLQVNGVRKSNGDPWPEASDIWHISSYSSTTKIAVVTPRTTHSTITAGDWTTTEVRAAAYASQHNTGSSTVTNHPDVVQALDNTGMIPVEIFELNGYGLYTYQYLRHNTYCKKYRMSNVDVQRVDQWDMEYVFPIVRTSQGLDLQNYGSPPNNMIREFNDVRWKADRNRTLVETQVGEPNMSWLVENVSVHYPSGSAGAPGTTGSIAVWDGTDPIFEKDEVFTTSFTYVGGGTDTAPTGVSFRNVVTGDIRGTNLNAPLIEMLYITAPRRGVKYTVTMTDTASNRFQIHTNSRGPTRCIAKGSAAIAAGTHRITLRIQSSYQEGRTAGFTVDKSYDIVVNSSGVITSITVV